MMNWIIKVKFRDTIHYCNEQGRPVSEIKKAFRWKNKTDAEAALEKWLPWFGSEAKVKIIKVD